MSDCLQRFTVTLTVLAVVWGPVGGALADDLDYGHCRSRYDQAVRLGPWKGIRLGQGGALQLYHLEADVGEEHDVSDEHPEVVRRIEHIMQIAMTPSPRYRVGELYRGQPLWQKH